MKKVTTWQIVTWIGFGLNSVAVFLFNDPFGLWTLDKLIPTTIVIIGLVFIAFGIIGIIRNKPKK
jgi:hypothetical protein